MTHRPTISVLMPVYNAGKFLREAIESILAQTYTDFEFIMVNDGSTDNSAEIIQAYSERDPRIRSISQSNQGSSQALNAGVALVQGEFIGRMDADDISLPTRFEQQVAFLRQNPQIGAVGCRCKLMDSNGAIVPRRSYFPGMGSTALKWRMIFGSPIADPSAMMRAEVLKNSSGYVPGILARDYEFWLRSSSTVLYDNLPEPLHCYRIHPNSLTTTKPQKQIHDASRARQQHLKENYNLDVTLAESIALQTGVSDSQEQALATTRLIQQLWRIFGAAHPSPTRSEYAIMQEEYMRRLYAVWKQNRQPLRFIQFLGWGDLKQVGYIASKKLLNYLPLNQTT